MVIISVMVTACSTDSAAVKPLPLTPADWHLEAEGTAQVTFSDQGIDVIAPGGLTIWFREPLAGRVAIAFEAMAVDEGGPMDLVSDVNAFWMAREPQPPLRLEPRSGNFAEYDSLELYYVGIGGNRNTTTRLRRYGGAGRDRVLLPKNDRTEPALLLRANRWMLIRLIAAGDRIAVERDGVRILELTDPQPYREGWFGLRTTQSHLRYRNLTIERLP